MAKARRPRPAGPLAPYLVRLRSVPERIVSRDRFPFDLPFLRTLEIDLAAPVVFFRAEAQLELAELLEQRERDPDFMGDPYARYGGRSLKSRSHGEAFFEVFSNRLDGGLYLMDEPESALSPERQLALLVLVDTLVRHGNTQLIVATHSPILLSYPEAVIVSFDRPELPRIRADETSHVRLTRDLLADPALYWRKLRETDEHGG